MRAKAHLLWDNDRGVVNANTGEQVLQLVRNNCSEEFRRMAGRLIVTANRTAKREPAHGRKTSGSGLQ